MHSVISAWRGFSAQRFCLKKSKFFGKQVFVFCKFYFLILATRSNNCVSIFTLFESSLKVLAKLCIFKFANLNELWQFWQKCVNRTFVRWNNDVIPVSCVTCSLQEKDDKSDKHKDSKATTQSKPPHSADLDELIGDMAWCNMLTDTCCLSEIFFMAYILTVSVSIVSQYLGSMALQIYLRWNGKLTARLLNACGL